MYEERANYFVQIYKSVTNIDFYRYFEKRSVGKAFLYLLIVTLIFGTLSLIRPIYDWNTGVAGLLSGIKNEMPDFELSNGVLNVEGSPMIIGEDENSIIIIDTTGQTDESVLEKYETAMFVSRDKFIQKQNGFHKDTLYFKDLEGLTLTKENIENFIPILNLGIFFIVLFGPIGFFIGKLFSIFVISVLGLIICGIASFRIKYGTLIKLSFYAITTPIIIKLIIRALSLDIPFFAVIYYGVGTLYLCLAGYTLSRDRAELDRIQ